MGKEAGGRACQPGVCPSLSNKSGHIIKEAFVLWFLKQSSPVQKYHIVETESDETTKES